MEHIISFVNFGNTIIISCDTSMSYLGHVTVIIVCEIT
jgi:hypothetical protein